LESVRQSLDLIRIRAENLSLGKTLALTPALTPVSVQRAASVPLAEAWSWGGSAGGCGVLCDRLPFRRQDAGSTL